MKLLSIVFLMLCCLQTTAQAEMLWMHNTHNHEELRLRPLNIMSLDLNDLRKANHFFRSRKTNGRRAIHPRLLRALAHIQRQFDNRRIEMISGFRTPKEGKDLNSYHQVGRAADIRIIGVSKKKLFKFCRTLPKMGCGYYPKTRFVHIDVRGESGVWVDLSGPGESKEYVANPRAWLRLHGI